MNTFLDLLIVVVMTIVAVGIVAAGLMFLVKNEKVRKISFWVIALLGIYIGYVGVRIMRLGFPLQTLVAVVMALVSVGAIILNLTGKNDEKKFLVARIMATVALAVGTVNAFS